MKTEYQIETYSGYFWAPHLQFEAESDIQAKERLREWNERLKFKYIGYVRLTRLDHSIIRTVVE